MTAPSYPSPPVTRASLEQRLRNICDALGLSELRTRTSLAHTVVAQMLPAGVVKGGAAIKLRVGDQASRLTRDLDAARAPEHTVETYTEELTRRLAEGWHGFSGRTVVREPADPPDVPDEYVMKPIDVKLSYASQSYMTVQLELGHDEIGSTGSPQLALDAGIADMFVALGFPTPAPVPVLEVEHQIAQKVHACTTPPTAEAAMNARTTSWIFKSSSPQICPTSPSWPPSAGASSPRVESPDGRQPLRHGRAGRSGMPKLPRDWTYERSPTPSTG